MHFQVLRLNTRCTLYLPQKCYKIQLVWSHCSSPPFRTEQRSIVGQTFLINTGSRKSVSLCSAPATTSQVSKMPSPCDSCKDTCGDGQANCGQDCKCGDDCKCSTEGNDCGCVKTGEDNSSKE